MKSHEPGWNLSLPLSLSLEPSTLLPEMKAGSLLRACVHGRIIQRKVEEQDKLNEGSGPGDPDEEYEQQHGEIRQFALISGRSRKRRRRIRRRGRGEET